MSAQGCQRSLGPFDRVGQRLVLLTLVAGLILVLPAVPEAEAAVSVKKGSFTKITDAAPASQPVTGVGFQPKALILFTSEQTAEGLDDLNRFAIGFSSGSANSRSVGMDAKDAVATSSAGKAWGTNILRITENAGNIFAAADLTSFDSDGFTLNWTTNDADASIIHYIAIGGADVTNAFATTFTANGTTGNQSITGVGFQPDFVLFLSPARGVESGFTTHANVSLGFAKSSTKRGALSVLSRSGLNPADTYRFQRTDRCIVQLLVASGAIDAEADFVSMDSGGFTINWTNAPATGSTDQMFFLALKGGQYDVGSLNQPLAIGTQAITGVGFQPKGLVLTSFNRNLNTGSVAHSGLSFGASDGTNEGTVWTADQDVISPTRTARSTITTKVLRMAEENATGSNSTVKAEANLQSFDSDGFTLNWTTIGDTIVREVLYWAIGNAPPLSLKLEGLRLEGLKVD